MLKEILLSIKPDGEVVAIYDDELADLGLQGRATITRGSHIEPTPDGKWEAAIVDGPVLGPFTLRREALEAEVEYLKIRGII